MLSANTWRSPPQSSQKPATESGRAGSLYCAGKCTGLAQSAPAQETHANMTIVIVVGVDHIDVFQGHLLPVREIAGSSDPGIEVCGRAVIAPANQIDFP